MYANRLNDLKLFGVVISGDVVYWVTHATLLLALGVTFYLLFYYLNKSKVINAQLMALYSRIDDVSTNRRTGVKEEKLLYGALTRETVFIKLDNKLIYSGLRSKFHFLTTELYLVVMTIIGVISFVISISALRNIILSALIIGIEWLVADAVLSFMCSRRYNAVEKELLSFMNLVGSYAISSDELLDILEKSALGVSGPIREEVLRAVSKSRINGDATESLRRLEDYVENRFFKTFIRNLEMSSRGTADYSNIVSECRELLHLSQSNQRKLQTIYNNARYELFAILACGIVGVWILTAGVVGVSLKELFISLVSTIAGSIIVGYTVLVVVVSLYFAFTQRRS